MTGEGSNPEVSCEARPIPRERLHALASEIVAKDAALLEAMDDTAQESRAIPRITMDSTEARYDAQADMLLIVFPEGTEMRISRRLLEGLVDAKPEDIAAIEIIGGEVLWWERLEVGHVVSDLVQGWYGSRASTAAEGRMLREDALGRGEGVLRGGARRIGRAAAKVNAT